MEPGEMADDAPGAESAADSAEAADSNAEEPYPLEAPANDGDDVARDPDAIAREIEQTRAELADTIDAIADRMNPRRAASRGAQAVKAKVVGGSGSSGASGSSGSSGSSGASGGSGASPEPVRSGPDLTVERTPQSVPASSSLPVGPIVAVAGVVLVILLFLRRRRSR